MLEQLFGSQTRMKLLHLFLSNAEEKYFVRELTRLLDSQINAIRRELENLADFGIIILVEEGIEGKRKFYQANTKFVLYPELKSIFQKSQFLLEKKFAKSLKKIGKVYYLALTGAFVGDKSVPIDLLIVGSIHKKKFLKILKSFEKDLRREINYTLLDKEEFEYRRSVADRYLYSILDAEKIVMVDEIFNKYEPEDEEK
jgi:predicted transcriptional regulator